MDQCTRFQWKEVSPRGVEDATNYRYGAKAVLLGHYVYLVGVGKQAYDLGDILDLRSKKWTKIPEADVNLKLQSHTATLYNDLIILLGVEIVQGEERLPQRDPFALDVSSGQVRKLSTYGPRPEWTARSSGDLYEHKKQLVLYGGNRARHVRKGDTLRILNLQNMTWQSPEPKGAKPPPCSGHSSCIVQHTLFVVGGETTSGYSQAIYLLRLDQSPRYVWQHLKPRGYPGHHLVLPAVVCLGTQKILLFGGFSYRARNELYILEVVLTDSPEWHEVSCPEIAVRDKASQVYFSSGSPPEGREGPLGVALLNKVIILGGHCTDGNKYFELSPQS